MTVNHKRKCRPHTWQMPQPGNRFLKCQRCAAGLHFIDDLDENRIKSIIEARYSRARDGREFADAVIECIDQCKDDRLKASRTAAEAAQWTDVVSQWTEIQARRQARFEAVLGAVLDADHVMASRLVH